MKKVFEYIGLFAIIAFSFFYTEKAALYVQSKNPIMQSINEIKEEQKISSINAIIDDNTIIPGLYGKEVNVSKSFNTMKSFGLFNKYYLVFDSLPPEISLNDNLDKIIISGNKSKRQVAIIASFNENILKFLKNKGNINVIATLETISKIDSNFELINAESKQTNFEKLESELSNLNRNSRICLTNTPVNITSCKKLSNYIAKPSLILKNNIAEIKKNITNGSIIFIDKTASLTDIDILLNQIEYQGLEIVYLSELISENPSSLAK